MKRTSIPIPIHSTPQSSPCTCNCRWASRFIFKAYHNMLTENDRYSEEWAKEPVFS